MVMAALFNDESRVSVVHSHAPLQYNVVHSLQQAHTTVLYEWSPTETGFFESAKNSRLLLQFLDRVNKGNGTKQQHGNGTKQQHHSAPNRVSHRSERTASAAGNTHTMAWGKLAGGDGGVDRHRTTSCCISTDAGPHPVCHPHAASRLREI